MSNKKELIAASGAHPESEEGKELSHDWDLAQRALEEANAQELYALWESAIKTRGQVLEVMGTLYSHYKGDKGVPLYQPSNDAIGSMERVALAAIDLAKNSHKPNGKGR